MKKVHDHYFHQAKKEKYPARSIYKLKEIQDKFKIIKKKQVILDLGCVPGSWSQYVLNILNGDGTVIGIDIQKMESKLNTNFLFFQEDVFSSEKIKTILEPYDQIDLILSDMAPKTSGIKQADSALSHEIALQTIQIADNYLKKSGALVFKYFQGQYFEMIKKEIQRSFQSFKIFKPDASRKESVEVFFICFNKL